MDRRVDEEQTRVLQQHLKLEAERLREVGLESDEIEAQLKLRVARAMLQLSEGTAADAARLVIEQRSKTRRMTDFRRVVRATVQLLCAAIQGQDGITANDAQAVIDLRRWEIKFFGEDI